MGSGAPLETPGKMLQAAFRHGGYFNNRQVPVRALIWFRRVEAGSAVQTGKPQNANLTKSVHFGQP
jgi:hypothetical protein